MIVYNDGRSDILKIEYVSDIELTDANIGEFFGVKHGASLYETWGYYFDGAIRSDAEMLEMLVRGLLVNKFRVFCLKVGNDFCWFRLNGREILKLGAYYGCGGSRYELGVCKKQINYEVVKSGGNLRKVCWCTLSSIGGMLDGVEGLSGSLNDKLQRLSSRPDMPMTADGIVGILSENVVALGLHEYSGGLKCRDCFYKDYSMDKVSPVAVKNAFFGIVLDCEGVSGRDGSLQSGCREVGGIIFSEVNGYCCPQYKFVSDDKLLVETLTQVIDMYRVISDKFEPRSGIPTYVYGASDRMMLESQIEKTGGKRLRGKFRFIDVKHFVNKNCGEIDGKHTVQNIAKELGVFTVRPKHSALADARTLFNILAELSRRGNSIRKVGSM